MRQSRIRSLATHITMPARLAARLLITITCAVFVSHLTLANDSRPVLVGQVTKVVDGDTLDIQLDSGPIRVRLYAVDAPEKSQPHGKESAAALTALVSGKRVEVESIQQDRYSRLVGIVYVDDINVNAELIRKGHAWAYRRYMRRSDAKLCEFETEARRRNRGLWAGPDQELEAPWEWRNKKLEWVTDFSKETTADCVEAIGH